MTALASRKPRWPSIARASEPLAKLRAQREREQRIREWMAAQFERAERRAA